MRSELIDKLLVYVASEEERPCVGPMLTLLQERESCFYRDCFEPGHLTGSALLVSPDLSKVLLNHHKIFNMWMPFGGHADGDEDIGRVALRETIEESGIEDVAFLDTKIFDIDIHPIPPNPLKGEPAHAHFDVTFLLRAGHKNFVISDESNSLRWCSFEEALELCPPEKDKRMRRILYKWAKGRAA